VSWLAGCVPCLKANVSYQHLHARLELVRRALLLRSTQSNATDNPPTETEETEGSWFDYEHIQQVKPRLVMGAHGC
jgi:hypothetical protein